MQPHMSVGNAHLSGDSGERCVTNSQGHQVSHHSRNAWEQYDKRELSVTEIARMAGVSRQTLYRHMTITGDQPSSSAA
jgi:transcriptional regulator of acetoin/glycerol metabolism